LKEAAGGVFAIPKGATTMQIEMRDTAASVGATTAGFRLPTFGLRWGAVFAGLAVGIATNIVLLLVGVAAGLAAIEVADGAGEGAVTIAAGIWHTLSMMAAALAGGYVAARASGLRRTADGMLHGAVAWGVAMVLSLLLATTVSGALLGRVMPAGTAATPAVTADVMRSIDAGQREAAVATLQERLGLSPDQANRIVDQALVLAGREEQASAQGRTETEQALRTASAASGWLSAAILLSLLAGIAGGALGARGTRRVVHGMEQRRAGYTEVEVTSTPTTTVRVE
jgi:hypothetical protein